MKQKRREEKNECLKGKKNSRMVMGEIKEIESSKTNVSSPAKKIRIFCDGLMLLNRSRRHHPGL